jgi:hypothetical protein
MRHDSAGLQESESVVNSKTRLHEKHAGLGGIESSDDFRAFAPSGQRLTLLLHDCELRRATL